MSRLTPESARSGAHQARPLSDFTPQQRRLLLALIEADTISQRRGSGGFRPVPAVHDTPQEDAMIQPDSADILPLTHCQPVRGAPEGSGEFRRVQSSWREGTP